MLDYQIIFLVFLGGFILGVCAIGLIDKVINNRKQREREYIRKLQMHDKLNFYKLQEQLKEF